jgi:hypothetical protein
MQKKFFAFSLFLTLLIGPLAVYLDTCYVPFVTPPIMSSYRQLCVQYR